MSVVDRWRKLVRGGALLLAFTAGAAGPANPAAAQVTLRPVGVYAAERTPGAGAEIGAYHPASRQFYVVRGDDQLAVLSLADPAAPHRVRIVDLRAYGVANGVAIAGDAVAVAVESRPKTAPGQVVFLDAATSQIVASVRVGPQPDMLCFTPDGRRVLVANEGEPNDDYTIDPEGSVSIIDVSGGVARVTAAQVRTADFRAFTRENLDPAVRVFGPGATPAQDFEPEYIAVSDDSRTAYVVLQENNALAIVDIEAARVTRVVPLGFKDHSVVGAGLDASDRDGRIHIRPWPVWGMYQPDAIAFFRVAGVGYLITANEGDSRDLPGFSEVARVADLRLDPVAFPNAAELQHRSQLGRLQVTTTLGRRGADGPHEALYAFGGRSFAIWSTAGELVYDSGDQLEQLTARLLPAHFNSDNEANDSFDSRSDNKGPEPEAVVVAELSGSPYAFVGLERIGGVMVFDVSDPRAPKFVSYANRRDFTGDVAAGEGGDLGPEGLCFIAAADSPNGQPLLVVCNEVSGTVTVFAIDVE